ncbi:MAG: hypothetical protein JWO38_6145 [Gemmataceae bacterium]|nr:hypothetical protein [Gemmataceae bacterium]
MFRGYLWLLAGLTPVYLLLAAVLPPSDDELYYWCWSEHLQFSYYDHPPMTAYMIRAATAVFGNTLFAIRVPAVISTLTVLAVIGRLTSPRNLLPLVVFTPLFTFGAVLVTPDTPLLMFWALYVAWLVAVHERIVGRGVLHPQAPFPEKQEAENGPPRVMPLPLQGRGGEGLSPGVPFWLWAAGGVVLGCGILGKYTTGLAVIAGFLSFLIAGNWRRWAPGYAAHLAVAFVVSLPILIHNIRYDFAPLQYQWKHSMASPEPGLVPFLSFVGIQLLLFGVLPFVTFVWTLAHRRELLSDPRLRVCACLFAFPFAFFLYKATRGPLEGNWALPCYIAVWPLAAVAYERARASVVRRRLTAAAFAIPAGCVVLLAAHLVRPVALIPVGGDRITRQVGKEHVVGELQDALRRLGAAEPVYVPSYQWTALLRFHQIDARQIDGMTRPSHFTQVPEGPAGRDHAFVFAEGFLPESYVVGFGPPRILGKFPLVVRGEEVAVFWLLEYSRSEGVAGHAAATAGGGRLDQPPQPASP